MLRLVLLCCVPVAAAAQPLFGTHVPRSHDDGLIPRFSFELIEMEARGRLGVAVLDTETGRFSGWGETRTFALNSTVKFLLCAAILQRVDAGRERLDREIPVAPSDLGPHAPVVAKHVGWTMTVAALCEAAMTTSDNAAANLLFAGIGGPEGLTVALRAAGDTTTRSDRIEPALNAVGPDDPRDRTTPLAMVEALQRYLLGDRLSVASRDRLLGWMQASRTGADRIRAGVPEGWTVGDRTGTGPRGNSATIAVILPPGRRPILMAVYVSGSTLPPQNVPALHAELARIATANALLSRAGN